MNRRQLLESTAAALATPALAQSVPWPTRGSIRLIAQFPPGGLVDTISRLMAPALSQALGQTVLVENRAGAGGVIGTDFVAKAPADGYTLLVSHASVQVFSTATMPVLPFDPITDFTHMVQLVEAANVLLVKADSPYRTLEQYLTAARLPAFPNVPTFAEQGFARLTSGQWLGLSGPKNLPAPIVERLTAIVPDILKQTNLSARFEDLQTMPRNPPPTGNAFVSIIRQEIAEWTAVARQFNILVS